MPITEQHTPRPQCQNSHYASASYSTSTAHTSAKEKGSNGNLKTIKTVPIGQKVRQCTLNAPSPPSFSPHAENPAGIFTSCDTSPKVNQRTCRSKNKTCLQNHRHNTCTPNYAERLPSMNEKKISKNCTKHSTSADDLCVDSTFSSRSITSSVYNSSDRDPNARFLLSLPVPKNMADMTPLPSPTASEDSSEPWERRESTPVLQRHTLPASVDSVLVTSNGESISSAIVNQQKRLTYQGFLMSSDESTSNSLRENEEEISEVNALSRIHGDYDPVLRNITIKVPEKNASLLDCISSNINPHLKWESIISAEGNLRPIPRPPTPPASRMGYDGCVSDSDSSPTVTPLSGKHPRSQHDYFEAYTKEDTKPRRWRSLKLLGEGTFSKVILATSQIYPKNPINEAETHGSVTQCTSSGSRPETVDLKNLVAVKICEYGRKGGFSEERVEVAFKRELEFMKSTSHPSLAQLKAWNIEQDRIILILDYCPGGDLFEIASEHHDLLVPSLLRRIFSELVAAVRYLHDRHIVHRDIKLENVLVNLSHSELSQHQNWNLYPYSIITLTDLGLSREIADDEKLTTRCGSDDYAAPEVIMGQEYDGRATDAWSLGVLLYALLENHLPFDPAPGVSENSKQRSRTSHRIARVEWCWVEFAGTNDEHEGDIEKFRSRGLEGAMIVTEGLLKRARSRWSLKQVAETEWVRDAVQVEGGIRFRDNEDPKSIEIF